MWGLIAVIYLIVWSILEIITVEMAESKQRSTVGWFFIVLALGLLGLIILSVLPNLNRKELPPLPKKDK